MFAGTDRMQKRDFVAIGSWIGIAVGLWIIAWIIASAIPVFSNLLSLMVREDRFPCFIFPRLRCTDILTINRPPSSLVGLVSEFPVLSGCS